MENQIDYLEGENAKLKNKVDELEEENRKLKAELTLIQRYENIELEVASKRIEGLEQENYKLKEEIWKLVMSKSKD